MDRLRKPALLHPSIDGGMAQADAALDLGAPQAYGACASSPGLWAWVVLSDVFQPLLEPGAA